MKDISDGTSVGFRYVQFGANTPETVTVRMAALRPVSVSIRLDAMDGKEIAAFRAEAGTDEKTTPVHGAGIGKHAVYFVFSAEGDGTAAEMDAFTFD